MTIWYRGWRFSQRVSTPVSTRRWLSVAAWERSLERPVQTYISTSRDPYLNLSIEHDLLQKSARDSVVLFLYVNRPCVVIGRNQNPWLEVNLPLLKPAQGLPATSTGLGEVDYVRRRSGGGTVFHDEGNVNWMVICPKDDFTRDKHAEMVVRALRNCGIDRARVNKRHDIVLDQGERMTDPHRSDTHTTPYTQNEGEGPTSLKVSGSAYKITGKHRALHHGTCLLSSPNLQIIPDYLHSPARPFIKEARGVQSVSSPVGNIFLSNEEFSNAVHGAFLKMYSTERGTVLENVGEDLLEVKSISDGYDELRSLKYKFEQTPQFIISNEADIHARTQLELRVKEGKVVVGAVSDLRAAQGALSEFEVGKESNRPTLHEIGKDVSWEGVVAPGLREVDPEGKQDLLAWLRQIFPPLED